MFLFLISTLAYSQSEPTVSSKIDSTTIKIGERINFEINVEADSTSVVVFPEGQTFNPLEVIESTIDTFRNNDRFQLIKKYGLTQFDSGYYKLPSQQILINDKSYYTDSLRIRVNDVAVDTTKQKMYDIKELVEVDRSSTGWMSYLFWILISLIIIGGLLYWFVFRKKPLTEEEKVALLPPYDRALLELKKLEESKYLIQSEYKQYYSELTDIVRSYIEEDVNISALESTTDELILKLEMLKDSGSLNIDESTIKQFKNVLQTADLVKFAKSKPDTKVAETDRLSIEQIVIKTKEALPEPTEEELQDNEEYLEMLAKKKRKKKLVLGGIVTLALLLIATSFAVAHYGFNYVKDTVIGHPTKELLESEWITSEYGFPAIYMETPKVLKRIKLPIPEESAEFIDTNQAFLYGSLIDHFYILTTSTTFKEGVEFDVQKAIDGSISTLEAQGAKNIVVKQENIETLTGKTGVKAYGSMVLTNPKTNKEIKSDYVLLSFTENGGFQQLIIAYEDGDYYAEAIVDRITNSIDFKSEN
ncbi:hypothetical protein GWK08_12895 [Leptobacterium flavescens]|uniref:DUF4381 family protein n=2 Tax=Leptobacterium flavescens TaxID=472055 RepID=A0A6P0UU52_9FLAO|nr:hypothetical protein [Leptobacterium flavescens]